MAVQEKAVDDKTQLDEFVKGLKGQDLGAFLRNKSVTIEVYKSAHPDLPSFKIKKSLSLRSMELFVVTEEVAAEIRENDLVRKDTIK